MKWFGRDWGAPVCAPDDRVSSPEGTPCVRCAKPIAEGDQGLVIPHVEQPSSTERPWHLGCFLASIGIESSVSEQVVHVLHHGFSLCGMPGIPRDWPEGHRWVSIGEAHLASCARCKAQAGRP